MIAAYEHQQITEIGIEWEKSIISLCLSFRCVTFFFVFAFFASGPSFAYFSPHLLRSIFFFPPFRSSFVSFSIFIDTRFPPHLFLSSYSSHTVSFRIECIAVARIPKIFKKVSLLIHDFSPVFFSFVVFGLYFLLSNCGLNDVAVIKWLWLCFCEIRAMLFAVYLRYSRSLCLLSLQSPLYWKWE